MAVRQRPALGERLHCKSYGGTAPSNHRNESIAGVIASSRALVYPNHCPNQGLAGGREESDGLAYGSQTATQHTGGRLARRWAARRPTGLAVWMFGGRGADVWA